jgi:hypothetical protein
MDLTTVISNIIYTLVFFTIIIFVGIFIFSKKESGNKEKCLATCSSKDTTTKEFCDLECVEESCFDCGYKGPYDTMPNPDTVIKSNETDNDISKATEAKIKADNDLAISGSDPLIIAAKIKADSELLAAQNEAKASTIQIIPIASLLPPTTTLTLPPPPIIPVAPLLPPTTTLTLPPPPIIPVAPLLPPTTTLTLPPPLITTPITPVAPLSRGPSGLADSCKTICPGPSGNYWDPVLCTDTCSEVKCWDCAYKGPYLDIPKLVISTPTVSLLPATVSLLPTITVSAPVIPITTPITASAPVIPITTTTPTPIT